MRYLITFFLALSALTAFSQGAVDRIELGYQTSRRGIVWVRPGLPTHEPAWRISRDTNSIMWHNLTTGIRYDWSYDAGVWYARDFIPSTLPPLDVFTSGAATIDNTQATWINDDGVLHHYSQAEGAWLPDKISFQSAGPTDIAAGVSNGAAVYTTSLWQDSDDYLVYYWDGDSWELLSGSGTNLTYSGTSSPVTLNSSTGTDVTITAGTGVSLSATSTNMTITNSAPDQTVSIINGGGVAVSGTYPNFTLTATDQSATNEAQTLSVSGTTSGIISLNAIGGVGGGTATIAAGTNIGVSQSGGTITINNTGAAALSGVVNQIPYFNTTSTITTEAGSGDNSLVWDAVNNRLGIGTTGPGQKLDVLTTGNTFIRANSTNASGVTGFLMENATGAWSFRNQGNSGSDFWIRDDSGVLGTVFSISRSNGNTTIGASATAGSKIGVYGNMAVGTGYYNTAAPTNGAIIQGSVGVGNNSPFRTLHVTGEARITDLITDPPTVVLGADADGDLGTLSLSGLSISSGTLTATDASATNEAQTLSVSGTTSGIISLNAISGVGGGTATIAAGTGITVGQSGGTITITNSAPDQTVSITGAGINVVTGTYPNFTITGTEVDGSVTNEGVLGVGAGGASSSTIISNTSGATGVTINAAGILTISESTSSNGGSITITGTEVDGSTTNELQSYSHAGTTTYTNTLSGGGGSWSITGAGIAAISQTGGAVTVTATEVDGSVTNEAQTLSVSGTTSGILTLSTAGGAGGGTATIAAGTGISVAQSGGTITITNSSPATAGWLIDGNTIAATRRIGSNDNFDVVVETNNTDRMWFDNAGTVSIGATQLTTAQFNINGFGTTGGTGMLIAGGASLTGPTFYSATGSGSGSNATVLSGVVNMLNGNVETLLKNSATTGTGGALLTLNTHQSATGDPKIYWTTNGTTDWVAGIDNSISGEPWKLTANSDIGAATPAISATTANKVGVNQAAASVTLQVTGTDAVGLPSGTIAQRSAAAIPQIRHNNTFSGFEFYDPNKNYWYRLTGVSSPTVATSAAAGTGATAGLVSGAGSNDVRGAIELTTGSASLAVGTVVNVTYSNPYSGTATNVILTPANDAAATEVAKWRVTSATQNGFSIRAVTALTASTTYQFNYSIGQ